MTTVTLSSPLNEATGAASPQLAAADAFAAHGGDVTLELADLTVGQLSAVAALMLALDAAEARARVVEERLADHVRHCTCHAVEVAEAEACMGARGFATHAWESEDAAFRAAA
jgi:hypothetical protein